MRRLCRPLPELSWLVLDKIGSAMWRRHFGAAGPGFHVSYSAKIKGARCVFVGAGFYAGPHFWIEAVERYFSHEYTPRIMIGDGVACSDFMQIVCGER